MKGLLRHLCLLALLTACAKENGANVAAAPVAAAPASWTRLPEQGGGAMPGEPSAAFTQSVRETFSASTRALEAASPPPAAATTAGAGKWHLGGMMANFGFGVSGLFGFIGFGGSTALEVVWARTLQNRLARHGGVASLKIGPSLSDAELDRQLEAMAKLVVATGKVSNTAKLKAGLLARAQGFRQLTAALAALPAAPGRFRPAELRLEMEVDAAGTVAPLLAVGGNVVLRFDWDFPDPPAPARAMEAAARAAKPAAYNPQLAALVNGLAQDLSAAVDANAKLPGSSFYLKEVKFDLGVAEAGQLGIATEAADVVGTVDYVPVEGAGAAGTTAAGAGSLPIVSEARARDPAALRFAALSGVPQRGSSFFIPHAKFRAGLAHAIRIGDYFAVRATEAQSASWRIIEISPSFNVSVGGALGLTAVSGTAGVEMTFGPKG